MYGVGSYFFGKILRYDYDCLDSFEKTFITQNFFKNKNSGLPFDIIFPLVYTLITYWFVGFNTTSAYHFFLFFLTVIVLNLTASSFGFFLGCMLPNAEVAVTLAPIMIIPFILFGIFSFFISFFFLFFFFFFLNFFKFLNSKKLNFKSWIFRKNCFNSSLASLASISFTFQMGIRSIFNKWIYRIKIFMFRKWIR